MTNQENEQLLPPEVVVTAVPKKLDTLAPWHRPRKHFVRKSQWARYAVELVQRVISPTNEGRLKYLTLPGLDYFDVEVIAAATRELGVTVELTAFQNQATDPAVEARCQVRTDSLVKRGLISDTVNTLPYSIEEIIHGSSQAARALKRRGPYDVINIDACGALAHPTKQPKLIHVIHKVVESQQNQTRRRWLLFVTVDIRQESTCLEVLAQLSSSLKRNIDESPEFADAFSELSVEFSWLSERSMVDDKLSRDSFLRQTTLAISKWLLHLGAEADWDVNSKTHYCYSTENQDPANPTMVCLAFEFIPRELPLTDPAAIGIPGTSVSVRPNYHLKAASKARSLVNLDAKIIQETELRIALASEQFTLLELAGYTEAAKAQFQATYLDLKNGLPV